MTAARVAIRRVRFKSGGELRLMPDRRDAGRAKIESLIREALDAQGEVVGFALVAWDTGTRSVSTSWSGASNPIPSVLMPDFVRNRLLAECIGTWTIDIINEAHGFPPDDTG